MLTTEDVTRVYDTILSTPGMSDTVKIDQRVSRRNILLLSNVIERGLFLKKGNKAPDILDSMPAETLEELKIFSNNCLQKAGLVELSDKLHALASNKGNTQE